MNPKWHMFLETERKWKILHNTVHKVSVICIYIYNDVHGVLWIHLTLHTCYRAESASSILYCSTDCIFSCFYTCKSRWWLVRILCSVVLFCVILHTNMYSIQATFNFFSTEVIDMNWLAYDYCRIGRIFPPINYSISDRL